MEKIAKQSKRQFMVCFTECAVINTHYSGTRTLSLQDIEKMSVTDDAEVGHAMMEDIDAILDLIPGQSLYFQPNRDDKQSKGFILRVR